VKVASASAENSTPVILPSAPVWPSAAAAENALIRTQPQAAPAISCAATTTSNVPENSIATMATAPINPNSPITGRPPQRLVIKLAGNIAMLKPTQNTGIKVETSLVNCLKR